VSPLAGRRRVHVVDYGMGNLTSVRHALEYLGAEVDVSSRPADLDRVGHAILPGVGSFRAAMHNLGETGWVDAIRRYAADGERQLLGICLGMQLLGASSPEDGTTAGLGLVDGIVERFPDDPSGRLRVPHVGFARVRPGRGSRLLPEADGPADFYFVHSYRIPADRCSGVLGLAHHGSDFVAMVEHGCVAGTQFHPEKSQSSGLALLSRWLGTPA
jgi:glutamine amidotransferase